MSYWIEVSMMGKKGTLSADPVMKAISNQIKKLTENSLVGFGSNSRYLSELGIQTKRDEPTINQ